MNATFRSFRWYNYRLWFAGFLVSNVGTWMQRVAQDWLVLADLTDNDAAAVGVLMALQFGPPLLLAPISGVIIDRFDRRWVVLSMQGTQVLLALGLGILTISGIVELWMVFAFALGLGIVNAVDTPARQAFVGELVPPRDLPNAVALNSTSFNAARLIGPGIAGILVAVLGAGWVFIVNAAATVAMLVAVLLLRRAELETVPKTGARRRFSDGLRYIARRGDIRLVFAIMALTGTLAFNFMIFTATMARVEFGLGADAFGVLTSVTAIGSITGALLSAARERPRLRTLTLACTGLGAALLLCAVAPEPWTYGAALALLGFCSLTMMTTANAYVQTNTPPALRGRVMAVYLAVFLGGTPVGAPLIGWIVNLAGPRVATMVGAASCIVAAGIAVAWYARRREMRLAWVSGKRWPIRIRTGRRATDQELATTEIAIVEAGTTKT